VNSAKTEMKVQEDMDKKRFQPPYTETVEYQDKIYREIKFLKDSK